MVSALLNDALRLCGVASDDFLEEFRRAERDIGRWSSHRSPAFARLAPARITARIYGEAIAADVDLGASVHCMQWNARSVLVRIIAPLPAAVEQSLVGLDLSAVIDDPLLQGRTWAIDGVIRARRPGTVLLTCEAPLEHLCQRGR